MEGEESEEEWEESPTDFVRRNDPDTSEFEIDLSLFSTDPEVKAFAEALEQNEYINGIVFLMGGMMSCLNWDPLFRVLSSRRNLTAVVLSGNHRVPRPSSTVITMFLRSLQQNAKISRASFVDIIFSDEDIGFFVDTAGSVDFLCFAECDFLSANQQQDASNFASAIQRKTNLDTLVLDSLRDMYLQQIVQCLGSIVCLNKLIFAVSSLSMNEASSLAIQHLLVSTKTITGLYLSSWNTNVVKNMVAFRNIVQGLINSTTVQNVVFSTCTFGTSESIGLLSSFLQEKQNLHSLEILDCILFSDTNLLMKALSGCLVRADSAMRNLSFHGTLPDSAFSAFLNAVEKSKLEQLSFSKILSLQRLQMMAKSISTMKVKDLVLYFEYNGPGLEKALLEAVKKNSSLQSYRLVFDHPHSFHGIAIADAKWDQCLVRNKKMAEWIEKPSTITKCVWPDALASAAEVADPSLLFQALRTVGSELGPSAGKRKRKRPSFYIPS